MQRAAGLTLAVLALLGAGPAHAAFSGNRSASAAYASAVLGAPRDVRCTSPLSSLVPVTISWTVPAALVGKGQATYAVERRANSGAWSTIASGITATSWSDSPWSLGALGTQWQYRVRASYRSWTGPVSTTVTATYTQVALITVLSTCA